MTEEEKKTMTPEQFAQYKKQLHEEAQRQFAEKFKRDRALSVAQLEELKATLKAADEKNETLKILNQAKEDAEKAIPGMTVEAIVNIDPDTGNSTIVNASVPSEVIEDATGFEEEDYGDETVEDGVEEEISGEDFGNEDDEDLLPDLDEIEFDEEAAAKEREEFSKTVAITPEDIIDVAKEESGDKFDISTETASDIILVIDKIRSGQLKKEDVTYKMMPQQVKEYIDKNISSSQALAGAPISTTVYNTYRNNLTKVLIDHYLTNITTAKYLDDIGQQISALYDTSTIKMSPMLKKFNNTKLDALYKTYEATENEEDKARIKSSIDAIEDAYNLTRLKEMKTIKIKSIEMEQPQKVYRKVMYQYTNDAEHSFYDAEMCVKVLQRHLNEKGLAKSDKDAQKFMLAFCKFCDLKQYKMQNQDEHLFMYFLSYNIMLLDAYKEDDYEEYANTFLNNIVEVLDTKIKCKN